MTSDFKNAFSKFINRQLYTRNTLYLTHRLMNHGHFVDRASVLFRIEAKLPRRSTFPPFQPFTVLNWNGSNVYENALLHSFEDVLESFLNFIRSILLNLHISGKVFS